MNIHEPMSPGTHYPPASATSTEYKDLLAGNRQPTLSLSMWARKSWPRIYCNILSAQPIENLHSFCALLDSPVI